jgi:Mn-dependent DtxR family transcriptional regulator
MITVPDHILERKDIKTIGKLILSVLEESPITTSSAVARRMRVHPRTVQSTLRQMAKRGVVRTTRMGNRWRYEIL